jgi:hypothetical protein
MSLSDQEYRVSINTAELKHQHQRTVVAEEMRQKCSRYMVTDPTEKYEEKGDPFGIQHEGLHHTHVHSTMGHDLDGRSLSMSCTLDSSSCQKSTHSTGEITSKRKDDDD